MVKVFLDVGGHRGESSSAAARFDFDVIHIFEPSPRTRELLGDIDPRVQVHQFGLWREDTTGELFHGNGTQSSSLYSDKRNVEATSSDRVPLRKASAWVKENLSPDDTIILKVNVEGAEVEIFRDLEEGGVIDWIDVAVVYPDYRKVESLKDTGRAFMRSVYERHPQVKSSVDTFDMAIPDIEARTVEWLGRVPSATRLLEPESSTVG